MPKTALLRLKFPTTAKLSSKLTRAAPRRTDATASSGRHDAVSAAIGGGTDSTAHGKDAVAFDDGATTDSNSDNAKASGHEALAYIDDASTSTATADGTKANAEVYGGTVPR